jgi:cysteine desulfurase
MNVYFDYAATTPQDSEVTKYITGFVDKIYGNPSSVHRIGKESRIIIEEAREIISNKLGCLSGELVFTSGGTESNNLALVGATLANKAKGKHIIVSAVEHPSVMEAARYLSGLGFSIECLITDESGAIDVSHLEKRIRSDTILVSVMAVNNETGIIHPVNEIGELCKKTGAIFHCDAVQAFGKINLSIQELNADLLSVSAHKIYGPKGIGALFIRRGVKIESITHGGKQEARRRAGTENLSGIIGFAKTIEILNDYDDNKTTTGIQKYFEKEIHKNFPDSVIIGENTNRVPFISNVAFPGYSGEAILYRLDLAGICVSTGSACSSGSIETSPVLKAMHLPAKILDGAVRFSFGRFSNFEEVDYVIEKLMEFIE